MRRRSFIASALALLAVPIGVKPVTARDRLTQEDLIKPVKPLESLIYDISPTQTPFLSTVTVSRDQLKKLGYTEEHKWHTDTLVPDDS